MTLIAARKLSPVELTEAALARIEALDHLLFQFRHTDCGTSTRRSEGGQGLHHGEWSGQSFAWHPLC